MFTYTRRDRRLRFETMDTTTTTAYGSKFSKVSEHGDFQKVKDKDKFKIYN